MVLHAHRRRDRKRSIRMQVLLDGVLAKRCYYADGRRGVIREFVEGEDGKVLLRRWRAAPSERYPAGEYMAEIQKRERRGKITWQRTSG